MNDLLSIFGEDPPAAAPQEPNKTVTDSQRQHLRELFAQMNVVTTREQFQIVEEVTGQRLNSVQDLLARNAQLLILQLPAHIRSRGKNFTGNAWDDRDEDTWIDKL